MNVIRHNHKRDEIIERADCLTLENCIGHMLCHVRHLQPNGTASSPLQFPVFRHKCRSVFLRNHGERPVEPKRDEQERPQRLEVR